MKKPSVPKCFGGSQKIFLGCSTSSLAVFYVEQVALNRHVRRHFRLLFLCALRPEMSSRKNSEKSVRRFTRLSNAFSKKLSTTGRQLLFASCTTMFATFTKSPGVTP